MIVTNKYLSLRTSLYRYEQVSIVTNKSLSLRTILYRYDQFSQGFSIFQQFYRYDHFSIFHFSSFNRVPATKIYRNKVAWWSLRTNIYLYEQVFTVTNKSLSLRTNLYRYEQVFVCVVTQQSHIRRSTIPGSAVFTPHSSKLVTTRTKTWS